MANVGYYSMTTGQGDAYQTDEITNNGDTAINVTVPDAAQLASLDALYVVNPSNGSFGAEFQSNLPDIADAVSGGMDLIIFDRFVTGADTILPGGSAITAVRDTSDGANVNVAAGAPASFTNGPAGTIDDTTFDGGSHSSHGYVELSSLPPGATPLLTTGDPTHVVAFSYPLGAGSVFYSTMPLDYYSGASNAAITQGEIDTLLGNHLEAVMCFTRGTLIETAQGPRPVEALRVGDALPVMSGGTQLIRWISSTHVNARQLQRNPKLAPVCITSGALGEGRPARDLRVSRQHRMLVRSAIAKRMFGSNEALVSAIKLTALPGIYVDQAAQEVEYFHILLDTHEVIWAEAALSETLFTGPEALKSLPQAAREEIEALFPRLCELAKSPDPAAFIPSTAHQKSLIMRHAKNAKALYCTQP